MDRTILEWEELYSSNPDIERMVEHITKCRADGLTNSEVNHFVQLGQDAWDNATTESRERYWKERFLCVAKSTEVTTDAESRVKLFFKILEELTKLEEIEKAKKEKARHERSFCFKLIKLLKHIIKTSRHRFFVSGASTTNKHSGGVV